MTAPAASARRGYIAFAKRHPRFLGFGFAVTLFSSLGQTYFISTFGDQIRAAFDLTKGDWGARYGLATVSSGLLLMWAGKFIDSMDLRRWTTAVVIGLAAACLIMAWTPSGLVLVFSLFCMRFAGQGLMGHTSSTSMARYFEAERGRALTIAGLGFALGFSVMPRIGVALQRFDWRHVWLVIAGVVAVGMYPIVRTLLKGHEARHNAWHAAVNAPRDKDAAPDTVRHWTRAQVLRDWRFYLLLPGMLACPCLMTGMIFFHDDLALAKGWTKEHLSGSMVIMGISLYVTSIVMGALVDRLGPRRLVALTQIPLGVSMLTLGTMDHSFGIVFYLAGAGMTMGSMGPVFGSLWPDFYGTRHLGSVRSLATSFMVLATAAAPWFFGRLLDMGVTMPAIARGSALYVLAGFLTLLIASRHHASPTPRRSNGHQPDTTPENRV